MIRFTKRVKRLNGRGKVALVTVYFPITAPNPGLTVCFCLQAWLQKTRMSVKQHLLGAIVRAHIISFNSKKVNLESSSSCYFTHFKGKEQWVNSANMMTLGPFLILDLLRSFSPSIFSAIRCRSPVNSLENFSPGFRIMCPLLISQLDLL